jgi:Holliday junction resolvase RusA-like endonuclease
MAIFTDTMVDAVTFFVPGRPQTAGSKVQLPIRNGQGDVVARRIVESGDRDAKAAWRADLRLAAMDALPEGWDTSAAMRVTFVFQRQRPKGHFGTGRNAGRVKDSCAGLYPVARPDLVKLARAAEDALTGIVWDDDAQIVHEELVKTWGSAGCRVAVEALDSGL